MNWLLLRGLSREQRHWGRFPEVLRSATGDAVHALDLPGAGTENHRLSPTDMGEIIADVRGRWLELKAREPGEWALLGISLGGMVSMGWCAAHPADFTRVALVNTSAGNLSPPWSRMDWRVLPSFVAAIRETDPVRREQRVLGFTARLIGEARAAEVAAEWAALAAERPPSPRLVLRQLLAATRFRAPERLEVPVLVVSGARDPLTSPQCAAKVAQHFKADHFIHALAGHDLPLDDAEWLAHSVAGWAGAGRRKMAAAG